MRVTVISAALTLGTLVLGQGVQDPGTYGPAIELVHLYQNEWPTGEIILASSALTTIAKALQLQALLSHPRDACFPTIQAASYVYVVSG